MKLKIDKTGVYLDEFRILGVKKIDLIDLRPSSKIVALQIDVDEVDIQTDEPDFSGLRPNWWIPFVLSAASAAISSIALVLVIVQLVQ